MTKQVRKASQKKGIMPFAWNIAFHCLNLQDGTIRHFPAGTYNAQVGTYWNRKELELTETVYRAWRAFIQLSFSEWGPVERRLAKWIMPKPEPPTRQIDDLIRRLWPVSFWTWEVMETTT